MIKFFLFYYLISGLINLYYTQKYWEDMAKCYPSLEFLGKDVVSFLQFAFGFVLILTWFPKYIWMSVDEWLMARRFNRTMAPKIHVRPLSDEEFVSYQEEQLRQDAEMMEKYAYCFQDIIDCGENKFISFYAHEGITINFLKTLILRELKYSIPSPNKIGNDNDDSNLKRHILIKENYYFILSEDKVYLLEGWKTACIITNPFLDGGQQGEKI